MKLSANFIHKLILFNLNNKTKLGKINYVWFAFFPVQLAIFGFLLLHQEVAAVSTNPQSTLQLFATVFSYLYSMDFLLIVIQVGFGFSLALILLAIVYMMIKKDYNKFDENNQWGNNIITFTTIILALTEICLPVLILSIKLIIIKGIRNQSTDYNYVYFMIVPILISGTYTYLINLRFRLLGFSWVLIPILLTGYWNNSQNNLDNQVLMIVSLVLVTVFSLIEIFRDEQHPFLVIKNVNIRKVMHWQIITISLWKLVYVIQPTPDIHIVNLINLLILIVLVTFVTCIAGKKRKSKFKQFINLCYLIKKVSNDTIKQSEKLQMLNLRLEMSQKIFAQNDNKTINLEKSITDTWSIEDWKQFVNHIAEYQYMEDTTLETGILILKMKLIVGDPLTHVLTMFHEVVTKYYEESVFTKYEILKIAIKINEAYFNKHEVYDIPLVHIIIQVNKLRDEFYEAFKRSIQEYYLFWDVLAYKSIDKIQKKILFLSKSERIMSEILSKIKKYSIVPKQKHLLAYFSEKVFNYNLDEDTFSKALQFKKQTYQEVFVAKKEKLDIVSSKLAEYLGYEKQEIENELVSLIIAPQFYSTIVGTIKDCPLPTIQIPYIVPFKHADGSYILRNVECRIILDLNVGYLYVFNLRKNVADKFAGLIYQKSTNMVKGFNNKFVEGFGIDRVHLSSKIKSNLINIEDLFSKFQQFTDQMKSQSLKEYNCILKLDKFGNNISNSKGVKLLIIESYEDYLIMRISENLSNKSMILNYKSKSMISDEIQEKLDEPDYQQLPGNDISCPIENPYKQKLVAAKNNLRRPKSINISCSTIALLVSSLILISVFCFLGNYFYQQARYQFVDALRNQQNFNTLIIIIAEGFELNYQNQIFQSSIQELKKLGLKPNMLLEVQQEEKEQSFEQFMEAYLEKNKDSINQKIGDESFDVSIVFEHYDMKISDNGLNLLQFAHALYLEESQEQTIKFCFNNYKNLVSLFNSVNYDEIPILKEYEQMRIKLIILAVSVSAVLIPLLIASICMIREVYFLVISMYEILFLIESEEIMNNKRKFEKIDKILNHDKADTLSYKSEGQQTIKTASVSPGKHNVAEQNNKVHYQKDDQSNEGKFLEEDHLNPKNEEQSSSQNQEDKKKSLLCLKISISLIPLLLLISFVSFGAILLAYAESSKSDFSLISQYLKIQNKIKFQLINNSLVPLHRLISQQKFNQHQSITPETNIDIFNNIALPEQFQGYQQKRKQSSSKDMCEFRSLLEDQYQGQGIPQILCDKVLGGILTLGFPKAFMMIQLRYQQVLNNKYSELFKPTLAQKYPLIFELDYAMDMMKIQQQQTSKNFQDEYRLFLKMKSDEDNIRMVIISGFIVGFLVSIYLMKNVMEKNSMMAVGYFMIVGNEILLQNRILRFMRDQKILERINKL